MRRTFRAVLTALLLFALVGPVRANDATPEARLESARSAYAQGRTSEARDQLRDLLSDGPALPAPVRQDALAYLGDILYSEEGQSAAEPFFRALLDEAPRYVMDPLQHPDEVSRYFESLRPRPQPFDVTVVKPALPPPAPAPWLALAPGGVYYFAHGKPGTGVAIAGVQAALLVTNLVLLTQVRELDAVHAGTDEVGEWRALELATDLTAGAFYLSLALPPAIEFGRWGVNRPPPPRVGVGPTGISLSGTF